MLVDISEITLNDIENYQTGKKYRRTVKKYLTDEEYEKLKIKRRKEYQRNYWINVRKKKKTGGKEQE